MLVARGSQGIVVGPSRSGTQRGDRIQCRFVNCRANTSVPLTTISLAGGFVPGDNVVLKKASTVQKNKAHIPKDTMAVVISSYKLDNSRIRIKFKHHGILHVPALLLKRQGEQDDGCEVQWKQLWRHEENVGWTKQWADDFRHIQSVKSTNKAMLRYTRAKRRPVRQRWHSWATPSQLAHAITRVIWEDGCEVLRSYHLHTHTHTHTHGFVRNAQRCSCRSRTWPCLKHR